MQNEEQMAQDEKKPVEEEETEETESEKHSREKLEAAGWTKVRCKTVCGFLEFYTPPREDREEGDVEISFGTSLDESKPLEACKEWYHMYRDVPPEIADPEDYEIEYQDSEDFPDYWSARSSWEYESNDSWFSQNIIEVSVWDKQSVWDNQSIEDEVEYKNRRGRCEVIKTSEDYVVIGHDWFWQKMGESNIIKGEQNPVVIVKDTPYYYEIGMSVEKELECPDAGFKEHSKDFINTIKCIID